MAKLSKAAQAMADSMRKAMEGWKPKDWAALNKRMAAEKAGAEAYEWHRAAYIAYLQEHGMTYSDKAGGYQAILTQKTGASYVDYTSLLEELKEEGYDTDDLVSRHTHKRSDTVQFNIKFIPEIKTK